MAKFGQKRGGLSDGPAILPIDANKKVPGELPARISPPVGAAREREQVGIARRVLTLQ